MEIQNGFKVDTSYSGYLIEQSVQEIVSGKSKEICRRVINLQDKGIRDALIKIGWTPPNN